MAKILITMEIESCKKCPNFTTKNECCTDDFDRMEDWHCNSADRKIQGAVEWHEERKIKIPDWCPILVNEASTDAPAVTVERMKFNEEFRREHPETIGETDSEYDMSNYKDWLEKKLKEHREQSLTLQDIRNKLSPFKNLMSMLVDRTNANIDKYIVKEIEQCKKSIEYLSGKFVSECLPTYMHDDVEKIIIGFEYCENEEMVIGPFETEQSFFNYAKNRSKGENAIINVKRKNGERLDWGMDCTFETFYFGRSIKYGYRFYNK